MSNVQRPFEILFEDEALVFVDKPAGMLVQPAYEETENILLDEVSRYLEAKGERAFLVQRLDRGTSGVMFFTKLPEINASITRQFEKKEIDKTYLAICEGKLSVPQQIDAPIARIGAIKFGVRPDGRKATTVVEPLIPGNERSVVAIRLLTGRTHQIRVHLSAIGHPLTGDWLYGRENAPRPMLHALRISLRHPLQDRRIVITAPVPDDFRAIDPAGKLPLNDLEIVRSPGDPG